MLEITAGMLSRYLNGKRDFTPEAIDKLGSKLGLSIDQIIEYQQKEKKKKDGVLEYTQVDLDQYSLISEWYFGVIVQLPHLKNFDPDPKWISQTLGLSNKVVKDALKTLDRLGFINYDGKKNWSLNQEGLISNISKERSSAAARRNLSQQHQQSLYALEHVDPLQRNHSSLSLAVSESQMEKARELITKFRRQFLKEMTKIENKDSVYQLNISFFPQTGKDK